MAYDGVFLVLFIYFLSSSSEENREKIEIEIVRMCCRLFVLMHIYGNHDTRHMFNYSPFLTIEIQFHEK